MKDEWWLADQVQRMAERREHKDLWWQMIKQRETTEEAQRIGVPPPGYYEEDLMETSHPGHPSNYGDQ